MVALASLAERFESEKVNDMLKVLSKQPELRQWLPASRTTAQTRGLGFPQYRYHGNAADAHVDRLVGHNLDYLSFRVRCGAISKWNMMFPVSLARIPNRRPVRGYRQFTI